MGGINCPPPAAHAQSAEANNAYVAALATYCDNLFTASSHYMMANVLIERAVLGQETLRTTAPRFAACKDRLVDAQSALGTVAALASDSTVDFVEQTANLARCHEAVASAEMELSLIDGDSDIQSKLWAQPGLTNSFASAMQCILDALAWQNDFARTSAQVPLTV